MGKMYFGKDVEKAIIEYNNTESNYRQNVIYEQKIYPALDKLAENIINNGKFKRYETTFDDFKADVVTHMTEKLYMFNEDKGKAYSYYNRIGRNYCIRASMEIYERSKSKCELETMDWERDIMNEVKRDEFKDLLSDFVVIWCSWLENNMDDLFNSQRDKMITEAIINIFRNAEDFDVYNKKLFNILIKEYGVGINTQNITKVVKILKGMFYEQFDYFRKTGRIKSHPYI